MSDVAKSTVPVQLESLTTGNPVSESALIAMAGPINYALTNAAKVGDVVSSDLDETTFQGLRDTSWWLCDGRSSVGTAYATLTGRSTIPDRRGTFLRMKDNGRALDPHGDLAIGTYEADQVGSHLHPLPLNGELSGVAGSPNGGFDTVGNINQNFAITNTGAAGAAETNPKYTVINYFVKVNV